jgi:Asp-tRNA(Asn)/Glu-tRNA(Gln) amidotransferase A subunit family amidase
MTALAPHTLGGLSALDLAALVQARDLPAQEMTRLTLERIGDGNPQVRAFTELWPQEAAVAESGQVNGCRWPGCRSG